MMGLLQIVGSGNRNHLVPPGIHPLGQPPDVPSLAGRIPTFIDQNHGNAETVDLMMKLLNLPLPGLQKLPVGVLAQLAGQIRLTQMRSIGKGRQFG